MSFSPGVKNLLRLTILMGVVEALIEFKTFKTTTEDVKIMVNLILFYTKVQEFIKEGLKASGAGKKKIDDDGTTSQSGSDADGSAVEGTSGGGGAGGGSGGGGSKSAASAFSVNKAHRYASVSVVATCRLLCEITLV